MKNLLKKITVLLGVAIVFSFALPLTTYAETKCDTSKLNLHNGAQCSKTDDQQENLFGDGGVFTTIVNVMLFLIGTLSVIMLIYGGIQYVISSGDAGKVNNAKNTILYAIVGLVVSVLAYAIVNFVIKNLAGGQE